MRWLLRLVVYLALVAVFATAVLSALILEPTPGVAAGAAPQTQDVQAAKRLLNRFRAATRGAPGAREIVILDNEVTSLLRLGERTIPGARTEAVLRDGAVRLRGAIPLRLFDAGPWVNVAVDVPDYDGDIALGRVRVGRIELRPELALSLGTRVADWWLGDGAGADLRAAFPRMAVTSERIALDVAVSGDGRGDLARTLAAAFRGDAMPTSAEVEAYREALHVAVETGALARTGSFTRHLRFVLDRAHANGASGDLAREYTAAVFALTIACGGEEIRAYVDKLLPGGEAPDARPLGRSPCGAASLRGRVDLRHHFITAAALRAASNRGVAISIGEFKELEDMGGASGFDFTDVVANNSGIRMSDRMMDASAEEWPALLALIPQEDAIIAPLDDVPPAMPMAEFETRYQDLRSAAYLDMLDRIEARIDVLALHAPRR